VNIRTRLRMELDGVVGPLPKPEKWVFVVGCYNSGTTLLHDLLACHPKVGSMPSEGQFYTDQLLLPKSVGLPRLWAIEPERFYMDERSDRKVNIKRLKRQWGARYDDPTRLVLLEKSPTNAGRTRWLQKHFENAHFIGIIRNGYAVAEGIHRKAGHELRLAALQWLRSNQIMLQDFKHLQRAKLIRYEDLTEGPETITSVLEFIGLEPVELGTSSRSWRIHEQDAPIMNMNRHSFAALSADERQTIEGVGGALLQQFGYKADVS
jgi:hypothetical protein